MTAEWTWTFPEGEENFVISAQATCSAVCSICEWVSDATVDFDEAYRDGVDHYAAEHDEDEED